MNQAGPTLRIPFSPRERQIANMIGRHLSYPQIAELLAKQDGAKLSPHTIRSYVINMATKIDFEREPRPEPRAAVYAYVLFERFVAGEKVG
jgi:DNA-binding CsgD family transcriptional regulator